MKKEEKDGKKSVLEKISATVSVMDIIKFVVGLFLGGVMVGGAIHYGPQIFESEPACPDCNCPDFDYSKVNLQCPGKCPEFNYSKVVCEKEYVCSDGRIVAQPEECQVI